MLFTATGARVPSAMVVVIGFAVATGVLLQEAESGRASIQQLAPASNGACTSTGDHSPTIGPK